MQDVNFLRDLIIMSLISIFIILLFHRFRIPSVVGMILTGILVGPSGIMLIHDSVLIHNLSELGVVLLLFTIGLEFSIDELKKLKTLVFAGGGMQVLITIMALGGFAFLLSPLVTSQITFSKAVFYGMVFSVSSTPICLKILKDRNELNTAHGKIALGVLIFQDIAIVPLMIAISFLNPNSDTSFFHKAKEIGFMLLYGVGLFGGFKYLIPKFLKIIAHLQTKEIWVFGALLLCFGAAYLSHLAGLSLALGAFLAGAIIAGYDESHKVSRSIEPIRDALMGVFFMSLGLLIKIELHLIKDYILVALAVIIVKGAIVTFIAIIMGNSSKISIMSGMIIAQVGEFSFVLSTSAKNSGLINEQNFQVILTTMVITMILAPGMIALAPRFALHAAPALNFIPIHKFSFYSPSPPVKISKDKPSVIVLGFGVIGRNVSSVLSAAKISHKILEMNLQTVKEAKSKKTPIEYGDCTEWETLVKMGIETCKAVVIAISDEKAVKEATSLIKQKMPNLFIIVRTRYLNNTRAISKMGADVVITEEFESSIQIFSTLLEKFDVDRNLIEEQERYIRANATHLFPTRNG